MKLLILKIAAVGFSDLELSVLFYVCYLVELSAEKEKIQYSAYKSASLLKK